MAESVTPASGRKIAGVNVTTPAAPASWSEWRGDELLPVPLSPVTRSWTLAQHGEERGRLLHYRNAAMIPANVVLA